MSREQIIALLQRREEAFSRHDVDALMALHADPCVVESPLAGGTVQAHAAIAHVYQTLFDALPDASLSVHDTVIEGNRVVQIGTLVGTDTGGLMGMGPSGKPAVIPIVVYFRIENGQIAYERRIYDFTGLLVQVGVLKAKPA